MGIVFSAAQAEAPDVGRGQTKQLAAAGPRQAQVIELRYFGGLNVDGIAA